MLLFVIFLFILIILSAGAIIFLYELLNIFD